MGRKSCPDVPSEVVPVPPPPGSRERQRGMALVMVILVLAVLGMAAAALLRTSRTEIQVIRGLGENAKAEALADAGIDWALFHLLSGAGADGGSSPALTTKLSLAGGTVQIGIENEAGKIDLNRSSGMLLAALFRSVGQPAATADRLAAAIEDFRDPDHERREGGAEDQDYEANGIGDGAKDGSFSTTAELLQVAGMNVHLYGQVETAITVHSPRRTVDIERAPPAVLKALGLLPGEDLKHLVEARATQAVDPTMAGAAVFSLRADATTEAGAHFIRLAILRRTQSLAEPFEMLEWRRVWSSGATSD